MAAMLLNVFAPHERSVIALPVLPHAADDDAGHVRVVRHRAQKLLKLITIAGFGVVALPTSPTSLIGSAPGICPKRSWTKMPPT